MGLVALACALGWPAACASNSPRSIGSVSQADLGDAGAEPAPDHEYAVFTKVATTPAPGARAQAAFAYDPARGVSTLYGGNALAGVLGDTWEYDGAKWQLLCDGCAGAPGARGGAAMAYASGRGVAVLFGGFRSPSALCETWEWSGANATWRLASDPACVDGESLAARRVSHAMADFGGDVVLFGGSVQTASGYTRSNALLRWNGMAWTSLCDADCQSQSSGLPAPRTSASLVHLHQGTRDVLWLFGGSADTGNLNDTWLFEPATARWSELCTSPACRASAPSPRTKQGAAFDPSRGRVVVHGGCNTDDCVPALSDVYEYDPASDVWTKGPPSFDPAFPDATSDFGIVFDAKRRRVVEFGGYASAAYQARTVEYYTRGAACSVDADCDGGTCAKKAATDATGVCAENCSAGASTGPGNFCAGGFRCNEPCNAPCQTCAAVPGVCTAITSGPDAEAGDAPGAQCSGTSTCVATSGDLGACRLIAGQTCDDGSACASGNCARFGSQVCAEPACGDKPCRAALPDGTCTVFGAGHFVPECQGKSCGPDGDCLPRCTTDDDCTVEDYCDTDATHECKQGGRLGGACKTSQNCGKGVCFDGVCCESSCGDSCQQCGKDGRCTPLPAGGDPVAGHLACVGAGAGPCAGYCDGVSPACTYPDGKSCGATCVEGDWRASSTCLHGACVADDASVSCGAYSCTDGECNTECSSNDECRRGATCDPSSGIGVCNDQGTSCSADGAGVKTASGTVVSCEGYPCANGACSFRPCSRDADCAEGYACTADHRCVEPVTTNDGGAPDAGRPSSAGNVPPGSTRDGAASGADAGTAAGNSGSSCSIARRSGDPASLALFGVALALALGRRRSPRRRPAV